MYTLELLLKFWCESDVRIQYHVIHIKEQSFLSYACSCTRRLELCFSSPRPFFKFLCAQLMLMLLFAVGTTPVGSGFFWSTCYMSAFHVLHMRSIPPISVNPWIDRIMNWENPGKLQNKGIFLRKHEILRDSNNRTFQAGRTLWQIFIWGFWAAMTVFQRMMRFWAISSEFDNNFPKAYLNKIIVCLPVY